MSKQYASKAEAFVMGVHGDVVEVVYDDNNRPHEKITDPALIIEFKPLLQHGTTYARALATRHFFPNSAWRHGSNDERSGHAMMGALPSQHPQPMYRPDNTGGQRLEGMTVAYDPTTHFGFFDTGWISEPKRRKQAEDALDNHGYNGIEYIEIVAAALPAPWPTYDEMRKGAGAHNAVLAAVKQLGIAPEIVIEYEAAQNDTKPGIVTAMEKLIGERVEAAVDEDALSRSL